MSNEEEHHPITDKELRRLLRARRHFEKGWAIIDKIIKDKYLKLALKEQAKREGQK